MKDIFLTMLALGVFGFSIIIIASRILKNNNS